MLHNEYEDYGTDMWPQERLIELLVEHRVVLMPVKHKIANEC